MHRHLALLVGAVLPLLACDDPISPLTDVHVIAESATPGEPVPVRITVRNDSERPVVLICDEEGFVAIERRENDRWVETGPVGTLGCRGPGSFALEAGMHLTFDLFEITVPEPGEYRFGIRVRRLSEDDDDARRIYSGSHDITS